MKYSNSRQDKRKEAESVLITPKEHGAITYEFIEAAYEGKDIGFPIGIADVDREIVGGIKPGDLAVIGARPGSGKSFMLNHILQYNATRGVPGLFVSTEMTATQLGVRGFSYTTRIDSKQLIRGKVDPFEWDAIARAAGERENLPLYLLAHRGTKETERRTRAVFTIGLIDAALEILLERGIEIKIVAMDYAQRFKSDFGQSNRKDIVDEVSSGAKDIALKWGVPVVLASQLNRTVEDSVPPIPQEHHFKESGNLEEDPDIIMTMFNPLKYYKIGQFMPKSTPPQEVRPNEVLIQLHKQRSGSSNMRWWCYFDARFAMLGSLENQLYDREADR